MDNTTIPFFSNTPDNTHCFQASLKMVLGYFQPKKQYTFAELDCITKKVEGLWTWPTAGLLWLKNNGFDVKVIETFDYERFIQHGGEYLIEYLGKEVGESQIAHSDIEQETTLSKSFLHEVHPEKRIPIINDIKSLLDQGYLVVCNVNARALDENSGYCGHFVVITSISEGELCLHDPGLPPRSSRRVTNAVFEGAWAYPDARAKNIMAFKYNSLQP